MRLNRHFGRGFSQTFGTFQGGVAPVISTTPVWQSPAAGSLGTLAGYSAYSQQFTANSPVGNALVYAVQSGTIPPGTSFTAQGLLSGSLPNPDADTVYSFTIRATDGQSYADQSYSLTVTHSAFADPYAQYVTGLYHFDNSWADASSNNNAIQATNLDGTYGLTNADSKFGDYCVRFGSSLGYAMVPFLAPMRQTGDFTVEFWMKSAGSQPQYSVMMCPISNQYTGEDFEFDNYGSATTNSGGTNINLYTGGGPVYRSSVAVNDGVWHHVALARSGSTMRLFVDGAIQSSQTYTTNFAMGGPGGGLRLGNNGSAGGFSGANIYMDELRITSGVCRYTANFTPPTQAFLYP